MYTTHSLLREPPEDVSLWRYMDLAKFLSLIESSALHLSNLQAFNDPYEGHPPRRFVEAFTSIPPDLSPEEAESRKKVAENNLRFFSQSRNIVCASCWHMSSVENAGMWAQYVNSGSGIAIRTTFARLKTALTASPAELQISGAVVDYVDFDTIEPQEINILSWAALKRQGFEHEKEFRLVTLAPSMSLLVSVDIGSLIAELVVAPSMPAWFYELMVALCARYQIRAPIRKSTMLDGPDYLLQV